MSFQEGWGRGTWGLGAWGTPLYVNVDLTGVASNVGLGDPLINAGAIVQVTTVGAVSASQGSLEVIARAIVYPASQAVTSALGALIPVADANVELTGLQVTSEDNLNVDVIATAVIQPDGIAVTVGLRPPLVYGEIDTSQTPGYATISTAQTPNYQEIPPARDAA